MANKRPTKPAVSPRKKKLQAAIIEAKLTNKPLSRVAEEEGVSRRTVTREAASDGLKQVITLLVESRWERVEVMYDQALTVLEEAMKATAGGVTAMGEIYTLGPDHYARMNAVTRYMKLLTVGRPTPKPQDGSETRQEPTWQDFRIMMDRYKNQTEPIGKR